MEITCMVKMNFKLNIVFKKYFIFMKSTINNAWF